MFPNPTSGALDEFMTLPSGGDTSYPGMTWRDNKLWVSYYSSHEGKPSIYVSQVSFANVPEPGGVLFAALGASIGLTRAPHREART